ncbi:MAG TPA: hypothetical protein DDW65_23600, partial [Firmicutes bacterium]|nr:hypothetical protein [Bacillota bacterium]
MSRGVKIYIAILSFALMFALGTGTRTCTQREQSSNHRAQERSNWFASLSGSFDLKLKETSSDALESSNSAVDENLKPADMHPTDNLMISQMTEPPVVKGVYLTGWIAGKTDSFQQLISFINKTEINSLVIDVKDDSGTISYTTEVPLAKDIGSTCKKYNPEKVLATLQANHIYP